MKLGLPLSRTKISEFQMKEFPPSEGEIIRDSSHPLSGAEVQTGSGDLQLCCPALRQSSASFSSAGFRGGSGTPSPLGWKRSKRRSTKDLKMICSKKSSIVRKKKRETSNYIDLNSKKNNIFRDGLFVGRKFATVVIEAEGCAQWGGSWLGCRDAGGGAKLVGVFSCFSSEFGASSFKARGTGSWAWQSKHSCFVLLVDD